MLEIKCTVNGICWNHPQTIPSSPEFMGKSSSVQSVPGARKSGDPWSRCKMVVACDEGSHGAEGKEQIWRLVDGLDASGKERRVLRVRRGDSRKNSVGAEDQSSGLDTLLRWHLGLYKAGNICSGKQAEAAQSCPHPKRLFQQSLWFEFSALASFHWGIWGLQEGTTAHHITCCTCTSHYNPGSASSLLRRLWTGRREEGTVWDISDDETSSGQTLGGGWRGGGISGGDCQLGPAWKICTKPPSVQSRSLTAETKMSIKEKHLRFLWGACHQAEAQEYWFRQNPFPLPARKGQARAPLRMPWGWSEKVSVSGTGLSTQMCLVGHRCFYYSSQELLLTLSSVWRHGCAISCRNFLSAQCRLRSQAAQFCSPALPSTVQPQASHLTSLCLICLICKMNMAIVEGSALLG